MNLARAKRRWLAWDRYDDRLMDLSIRTAVTPGRRKAWTQRREWRKRKWAKRYMNVCHEPKWEPTELPVDAEGNTKPGYECVHQLENGMGQCGGNTFEIDDVAELPHCCVVEIK